MGISDLMKLVLIGMVSLVNGCSPPEGGYVEPTPEELVHYSEHVVVGEVTEILNPDPMYKDMYGSTYGAMVTVQCTYKGAPLPGRIKIGGAGFVPGMCEAMPLEKDIKYVLFLHAPRENEDMYEQSQPAVNKTNLGDFLGVCDLDMQYPQEKGMTLPRKQCPPPSKLETCKRYASTVNTDPVNLDVPKKTSTQEETKQGMSGKGTTGGNGVSLVTSSLTTMLIPLALLFLH